MFKKFHLRFVLFVAFTAVFILSAVMLIHDYVQGVKEECAFKELAAITAGEVEPDLSPDYVRLENDASTAVMQLQDKPAMLPQYRELYRQNSDMAGWIKIDGTRIDYPVMYTPEDGKFYLTHGFDKKTTKSGVPFIDARCMVDPPGVNTILYGHHMKNGTMFAGLENYRDEAYYEEHPMFRFDTLYSNREYKIFAVFESHIYSKGDNCFKYYNFLNAESKADYDEYIANIMALALYVTGVTASYGDELLTLITCDYHTENGQFVVVAKKAGGVG